MSISELRVIPNLVFFESLNDKIAVCTFDISSARNRSNKKKSTVCREFRLKRESISPRSKAKSNDLNGRRGVRTHARTD